MTDLPLDETVQPGLPGRGHVVGRRRDVEQSPDSGEVIGGGHG
jgi:hypothetical protein